MLSKVVIVFLLAMVGVAMLGRAFLGKSSKGKAAQKLAKPPVCARCGRYLPGGGGCDCGQKG